MKTTYDRLQQLYLQKGYDFSDSGAYNLNIFGIRSDAPLVDEFNDYIGLAYRDVSLNKIVQLLMRQQNRAYTGLNKKREA